MRLRPGPGVLSVLLSAPVGCCAGAVSAAVYLLLRLTGAPAVVLMNEVTTVAAPVLGGLVVALLQRLAPEIRGAGVPQAMVAVADPPPARGVRARVALLHPLAAGLAVATGWSAGREGPAIFGGAAVGEAAWARVRAGLGGDADRVRVRLLAAGAAGGVAGAMNMPIAAFLLVTALLLRGRARPLDLGCAAVAAASGALAHHLLVGGEPIVPAGVAVTPPVLLIVVVALLAVPVGVAYTACGRVASRVLDKRWRGPELLRPVAGGVVIGALLLVVPQCAGTGELLLQPDGGVHAAPVLLAVLVAGKIVTTAVAAGTLRAGGLIGPALFLGGAVGQLVAATAAATDPAATGVGSVWVVGIAGVFAAASRLPLTAAASAVELTGSWSLALPVLACALLAAGGTAAVRAVPLFPGPEDGERSAER